MTESTDPLADFVPDAHPSTGVVFHDHGSGVTLAVLDDSAEPERAVDGAGSPEQRATERAVVELLRAADLDPSALGLPAPTLAGLAELAVIVDAHLITSRAAEDVRARELRAPAGREKTITAAALVAMIQQDWRIVRTPDHLTVAVPAWDGAVPMATELRHLSRHVKRRVFTTRGAVPGRDTVTGALDTVEALAEDAPVEPVHLRAAVVDGALWLNLDDVEGRLVKVTGDGWSVEPASAATPLFRRGKASAPLPVPERGDPDALRRLLGLDEHDDRWALVRGWLAAVLFADVPRPVLWATGGQGSGKSTRARMVLSVVEPAAELGSSAGRNEQDDTVSAVARYLPSWDNITDVSRGTSDWFCRLVTGTSDDRRGLYTDGELRSVSYRRAAVATSITLPPKLGADARERMVPLEFERVADDERRGEAGLWAEYDAARPAMLAAVLDDVAAVLRHRERIAAEERRRPRMADYADLLAALDAGAGTSTEAAYVAAVDELLRGAAEDDPLATAVVAILRAREDGRWEGTSTQLLDRVAPLRPSDAAWWPSGARQLSDALRRAAEPLRHMGVIVEEPRRSHGKRLVTLTLTERDDAEGAPAAFEHPF